MNLTREEQETHVWGNAANRSEWEIYTADPMHIRKFDRLGYQVIKADAFGKRYKVPFHAVRFGRLQKRVLSEKARENIKKAHSYRKTQTPVSTLGGQNR